MAGVAEEETDYESDPEEVKISLTMRRREASDDEEEEEDDDGDEGSMPRRIDSRTGIVSDYESDGQGTAADYDDEESEIEEEEEVEDEYEERVGEGEVKAATAVAAEVVMEFDGDGRRSMGQLMEVTGFNQIEEEKKENEAIAEPIDGEFYASNEQYLDNEGEREEEKKENEPFAVPTAGAFYMHDDRFRDSAGGRHRRTRGGRKLWESKDDKKWGHDKYEEMTMQERHYDEGRRGSRGRYRARGKNRGEDNGYPHPNRSKAYHNNNYQNNNAAKVVKGRGPRRYQPSTINNSVAPTQNRQPGKVVEKISYHSSGRVPSTNVESDAVPGRGNVFASSLSSASPPFYPSGSSNKEINLTQKKDSQTPINRNLTSGTVRGKNVTDSIPMDKLYINESATSFSRKPLNNMQLSQSRGVQGRGISTQGQVAYQSSTPHNQVNKFSPRTQTHKAQLAPVQGRLQPSLQASSGQQQFVQRPGSGSQVSSPPKAALSVHSFESGETEYVSESSKSKTALVGKGKGNAQASGMGNFPYSVAHGDQNFPGTPAFLPVMQFGGQHPGGMGVPAVGMAFPGYVAQPQLGMGNSEMTWLPVLAGAAGALGATYCPPYLPVDGAAYHHQARPSAQTSSLSSISSQENSINRPGNELMSAQRPEIVNDEFGQRQNKPRRYTEMKFDN